MFAASDVSRYIQSSLIMYLPSSISIPSVVSTVGLSCSIELNLLAISVNLSISKIISGLSITTVSYLILFFNS